MFTAVRQTIRSFPIPSCFFGRERLFRFHKEFLSIKEENQSARGMNIKIGVDVGGTNTDAVLLINNKLVAFKKAPTTSDITAGIVNVTKSIIRESQISADKIQSINIGTTHLINACIQRKGLNQVMALRLAGESTTALPPGSGWPEDIRENIIGDESYICSGGYEYDGKQISPIKPEQIQWAIHQAKASKIQSIAVTGVFANVNPEQELEVRSRFYDADPSIKLTVSHEMGGLGLIPRENASILNAASIDLFTKISAAFRKAVNLLQMPAKVFLTYGDGTKTSLEDIHSTPLKTFHSGPANSISGVASLTGLKEAVTVDIGGTSSDVGLLRGGEPVNENSSFPMTGLGIPCNLILPRINSFGLGGGSIIFYKGEDDIQVGPDSVGYELTAKALVFGGEILTPTDIAFALGRLEIGVLDQEAIMKKMEQFAEGKSVEEMLAQIDKKLHSLLYEGIKETLTSMETVPDHLVLVGGGAAIFDVNRLKSLMGKQFAGVLIPKQGAVANALGAARSKIGARFAQVYDYAKTSRNVAFSEVTERAKSEAIKKGAFPESVKVSSIKETQINYLSGNPHEVTVGVVGEDGGSAYLIDSASSPTRLQTYKATDQLEPLVSSRRIVQASLHSTAIKGSVTLSKVEVGDIAIGAGFLGSGGGGSPVLGYQLALNTLSRGEKIRTVSLSHLPDDALVVVFGVMGSPVVVDERPPLFL